MKETTGCEPWFKQHIEIMCLIKGLVWLDEVLHDSGGIFYSARQSQNLDISRGVKAGSMCFETASVVYTMWIDMNHLRDTVPFTVFALSCGEVDP